MPDPTGKGSAPLDSTLNNVLMYLNTELLEGYGSSTAAQAHSMSSIMETESYFIEETLSKY